MTPKIGSPRPASRAFFATAVPHSRNMTCVDCSATTWEDTSEEITRHARRDARPGRFLIAAAAVTWLLSAQSNAATTTSPGVATIEVADTSSSQATSLLTVSSESSVATEVATPEQTAESDSQSRVMQNIFNGVVFGLLLALASVGLSLIYGTTGLSNFAHGEQVSLGAMLAYFFATDAAGQHPPDALGLFHWLAALARRDRCDRHRGRHRLASGPVPVGQASQARRRHRPADDCVDRPVTRAAQLPAVVDRSRPPAPQQGDRGPAPGGPHPGGQHHLDVHRHLCGGPHRRGALPATHAAWSRNAGSFGQPLARFGLGHQGRLDHPLGLDHGCQPRRSGRNPVGACTTAEPSSMWAPSCCC